jgi:hypothetical protein
LAPSIDLTVAIVRRLYTIYEALTMGVSQLRGGDKLISIYGPLIWWIEKATTREIGLGWTAVSDPGMSKTNGGSHVAFACLRRFDQDWSGFTWVCLSMTMALIGLVWCMDFSKWGEIQMGLTYLPKGYCITNFNSFFCDLIVCYN